MFLCKLRNCNSWVQVLPKEQSHHLEKKLEQPTSDTIMGKTRRLQPTVGLWIQTTEYRCGPRVAEHDS